MRSTKALRAVGAALLIGLLVLQAACSGAGSTRDRDERDTVTKEDAARTPTVRLADLIQQRVPGITLTETPDGRLKVRIRGVSSFTSDNQPLFVVDDVPVDPNPDGSLPGVTLPEIEWIKVYKDPADTSRWGMRGANGVIAIKTKVGAGIP